MAVSKAYQNHESLSAINANYMGETAVDTTMTPIEHANETFQRAVDLASRIEQLSEHLCGVFPMAEGEEKSPQPSGVLSALQYQSSKASDAIQRAHNALDRVQRMI